MHLLAVLTAGSAWFMRTGAPSRLHEKNQVPKAKPQDLNLSPSCTCWWC